MKERQLNESRPIIEVFNSIEGESLTAGEPTIFVRLSGCNLRCMFKNSICDTAYSSFKSEKGKYTYQDIAKMMDKYPLTPSVSITGGEPFMYPEFVAEIIDLCDGMYDKYIIVETNGTIPVDKGILSRIDLLNISPKLSSSDPTQEKCNELGLKMTDAMKTHCLKRFNQEALWKMISYAKDFRLKYVIGDEKDFEEVLRQIDSLIEYDCCKRKGNKRTPLYGDNEEILWKDMSFIKPWNIVLMPAGATNEQLNQNRKMVAEYCAEHGFNYSDRLQIVIWGSERER